MNQIKKILAAALVASVLLPAPARSQDLARYCPLIRELSAFIMAKRQIGLSPAETFVAVRNLTDMFPDSFVNDVIVNAWNYPRQHNIEDKYAISVIFGNGFGVACYEEALR